MPNQPMAKVRVGSVEVALWENKDDKKGTWHSVTLQRHYKSEGEWKNTNSFRLSDLKDIEAAVRRVNEEMRVRISGKFSILKEESS